MSERDKDEDRETLPGPEVEPSTTPPEPAASPWPQAADAEDTQPAAADSIGGGAGGAVAGRPARRFGGAGTFVLLLLVVFLAGVSVWPIFGGAIHALLPFTWIGGAVDGEARERLTAIERRIAELEARPQPNGEDNTARQAISDLTDRLNAQSEEIARLGAMLEELQPGTVAPSADAAAAVNERLGSLEEQVAGLAAAGPPEVDRGAGDDLAALRDELAGLTRQLVETRSSQQALSEVQRTASELARTVSELAGRLADLEGAAGEAAERRRREARLLALTQLAAALRDGNSFVEELQAVQALDAGDADLEALLEPLQPLAPTGVPTLRALQDRFDAVAAAVVRAGFADAGGGWLDRTLNRLASLVTIRRTGEVVGDDPEALVARAEARLQQGDLAQALATLSDLTGAPAAAATDWLAQARSRHAADVAADRLRTRALKLLGDD